MGYPHLLALDLSLVGYLKYACILLAVRAFIREEVSHQIEFLAQYGACGIAVGCLIIHLSAVFCISFEYRCKVLLAGCGGILTRIIITIS